MKKQKKSHKISGKNNFLCLWYRWWWCMIECLCYRRYKVKHKNMFRHKIHRFYFKLKESKRGKMGLDGVVTETQRILQGLQMARCLAQTEFLVCLCLKISIHNLFKMGYLVKRKTEKLKEREKFYWKWENFWKIRKKPVKLLKIIYIGFFVENNWKNQKILEKNPGIFEKFGEFFKMFKEI